MKWIGALLFISTTTGIGFEVSKHLDDRPKHIRQLKNALQILEAEILYSQSPLKEAFALIAAQIPYPTKTFFKAMSQQIMEADSDLHELWQENIRHFKKISSLEANDEEILNQFGRTLGQHDFDQQQKHIHLAITHLDRELEEAKDKQRKYAKLSKGLGILCGLFIVLLLI
ncbi:MAG TPA: stage III sporulation protein SpoIIIAB [Bacillota bacterium]|nr:stage III sporulation protein SpoIIIAB [Bacillota bacterium]